MKPRDHCGRADRSVVGVVGRAVTPWVLHVPHLGPLLILGSVLWLLAVEESSPHRVR